MMDVSPQQDSSKIGLLAYPLWFGAVVLFFYLMKISQSLLIPFIIALVIWYLINALTATYQRISIAQYSLPRGFCFIAALLTSVILIGLLTMLVTDNIIGVVAMAGTYQANLEKLMTEVLDYFNLSHLLPDLNSWFGTINFSFIFSTFASAVTSIASNGLFILIYLFFLFLEQQYFHQKLLLAFAENSQSETTVSTIIERINADIQTYLWVKTQMSFLTGLLSYFILVLVGVDFAEFWAILIFLLNYIPNIGSLIATLFPALLALVQFGTLTPFFVVLIGITIVQVAIGNVLEPKIMGNSLNLSPTVLLFSLLLWGNIWGVWGMLLCVPIMVTIMIILMHFPQTRPIAILFSQDGQIK